MNQIKLLLIIIACLFLSLGFSYPNHKENNMELIKEGYIEISGGCEVYAEAKITFTPQKDRVLASLDNKGGYFWKDNNNPMGNFSKSIGQKTAGDFFGKLDNTINKKKETQSINTRNATVKIYLPLKGKTIDLTWNEIKGLNGKNYEIDPLLDLIDDFCGIINNRRELK